MIDFTICEFTIDCVEQALELLKQGYERERKFTTFLPEYSITSDKSGEL